MDNQQLSNSITNTILVGENISRIVVTNSKRPHLSGEVLVDTEILKFLPSCGIRISAGGYAVFRKSGYHPLHNFVLPGAGNGFVIDHINGDRRDNRKSNLRIVSERDNASNRTTVPNNNTGVVGISLRRKGNYVYYRAQVSDRVTPMGGAKSKTRQLCKQFNVNKLGDNLAFSMAVDWLKAKKKEFEYLSS